MRANPRYTSAWINLGVSLFSAGRVHEAASCHRRAIKHTDDATNTATVATATGTTATIAAQAALARHNLALCMTSGRAPPDFLGIVQEERRVLLLLRTAGGAAGTPSSRQTALSLGSAPHDTLVQALLHTGAFTSAAYEARRLEDATRGTWGRTDEKDGSGWPYLVRLGLSQPRSFSDSSKAMRMAVDHLHNTLQHAEAQDRDSRGNGGGDGATGSGDVSTTNTCLGTCMFSWQLLRRNVCPSLGPYLVDKCAFASAVRWEKKQALMDQTNREARRGNRNATRAKAAPFMVSLMSQAVEEGLAFIPDARLVRDFGLTFQRGDPSSERERWVHKPCIGGDSRGVQLLRLRDLRDFREGREESGDDDGWLVQKFIRNPFLIRGRKFTARVFAVVAHDAPLRVYVYSEGYTRASARAYYSSSSTSGSGGGGGGGGGGSTTYASGEDEENIDFGTMDRTACDHDGFPRLLSGALAVIAHTLSHRNVTEQSLWRNIERAAGAAMVVAARQSARDKATAESTTRGEERERMGQVPCAYNVYGLEFIFDNDGHPWLIDIDTTPTAFFDGQECAQDPPMHARFARALTALMASPLHTTTVVGTSTHAEEETQGGGTDDEGTDPTGSVKAAQRTGGEHWTQQVLRSISRQLEASCLISTLGTTLGTTREGGEEGGESIHGSTHLSSLQTAIRESRLHNDFRLVFPPSNIRPIMDHTTTTTPFPAEVLQRDEDANHYCRSTVISKLWEDLLPRPPIGDGGGRGGGEGGEGGEGKDEEGDGKEVEMDVESSECLAQRRMSAMDRAAPCGDAIFHTPKKDNVTFGGDGDGEEGSVLFEGYQSFRVYPSSRTKAGGITARGEVTVKYKLLFDAGILTEEYLNGRSLLDVGGNNGFFCFLAILRGASSSTLVEMDE